MSVKQVPHREKLYVDGEWRATDDWLKITDLADGGEFSQIAAASPSDAKDAIAAAQQAEAGLRKMTVVQRADWLESIADGIEEKKEILTETIVREAGKPISSAQDEVDAAAERFRRAVEEARSIKGEYIEGTTESHEGWRAIVRREPVGTVLCITPYNYPLSTTALQVAPALAAGNAVILKPATKTPVSAAILAEIIVETAPNTPDGSFGFVPGHGSDIGDTLAGDNRLNAIAMTGSSDAGKHVASVSGMVELHMELGGNAPAVIFPDADLETAVSGCASGSFKYAGQRCSAISRLLVHKDIHDEVVDRIHSELNDWTAGDLFDSETTIGPLISVEQADWVKELVEDAVNKGATLVDGGERDGRFFEPTLLADVPHDARIIHEEQFGPVAAVTTFEDESEALDIANNSDLGLDASVFTSDYDQAMRVANKLEAGSIRINGPPSHGLGDIPFGGVNESGIGREGIDYTIESFLSHKSIIL